MLFVMLPMFSTYVVEKAETWLLQLRDRDHGHDHGDGGHVRHGQPPADMLPGSLHRRKQK